MSFLLNPYRYSGAYDFIAGFGDSQLNYSSASLAYGPTPTAGTVKAWNPSTSLIVDVGATDMPGAGVNEGSFWPQLGIDHYNTTGRIPLLYNGGVGGSNWANPGDGNYWGPASTNYTNWRTNVQNATTANGGVGPMLILISLGAADIVDGTALATVDAAISACLSQVISDFPGVKIGLIFPGTTSAGISIAANHTIHQYLINYCNSLTDVWPVLQVAPFRPAGYYNADDIHVIQTGRNIMAHMINRWLNINSSYTDKWVRGTISTHFDEISSAGKAAIATWFSSMGSNWTELDAFANFHTSTVENIYIDYRWKYVGGLSGSITFTANSGIATGTTGSYYSFSMIHADRLEGAGTDYYLGTRIITNSSDNSAQRVLHGVQNGGPTSANFVSQVTAAVRVRSYDLNSLDYATDTSLQNNTFYANYRNGTTKGLWKNGSSVNTAVIAVVASYTLPYYVGCLNSNGSASTGILVSMAYHVTGQFTTSNVGTVYSACEALITANF